MLVFLPLVVSCWHLSTSLPLPQLPILSTQMDPAQLKGLCRGDIHTLKPGQADNSFHIAKEQLPLLFSPGL